jgi:hypothetical integral membrane protein (TIGR02206 family)
MSSFWQTAAEAPGGSGFTMYGPAHLFWLALIIGGIALLCIKGRRKDALFSRILALALPVTEIWKDLFLWQKGQFWPGNLPFYLCGFAMFLILADAFFPNRFLLDVLYGLCLPGTIGALLFPDWTIQQPFCFISAQSFVFHALLAAYIIFQLACGRRPHPLCGFVSCAVFLLFLAPLTKILDGFWGTNFLFLEYPPKGSPLVWVQDVCGEWYIAGFALFGAVLVETMYLPLQLLLLRRRRAA